MTVDPILASGPVILIHTVAAVVAFVVGPFSILRRRRDALHRAAGYTWVVAMVIAAVSALGIFELRLIGPLSPIHALPFLVGFMLWRAIRAIRAGNLIEHGRMMTQLYIWSMGVAGLFTLLPGRRMNAVLFDGQSWVGFGFCALAMAGLAWLLWCAQPKAATTDAALFPLHKGMSSR
ncbi:MAG: DUF2306 domain-containing protein [Pararhodobacter sp.]|nr:DUF2306 domain-containing protein [Pararhodobacter sp.]